MPCITMERDLKDSAMKDSARIFINFYKDQDTYLGSPAFGGYGMFAWTMRQWCLDLPAQ